MVIRLIRNPDFQKLWTAQSISVFGSQISELAIPLAAAIILNVDPFAFAMLATVEFLPFILFTLPAGAWVDRLPRRPILILGDLGRAIALSTIPLAYVLGSLSIWQLYVVGFVTGTFTVFFDVANQSYLPAIVERDQLVEGNAKLQVSQSAAEIAGPGVAGYLVSIVQAPFAILLDALSFVASAVGIFLIRRTEPPIVRHVDDAGRPKGSLVQEVREGLGFVLGNSSLRAMAASSATFNFASYVLFSIYILYAVNELHLRAATIGVVFAIGNVGTLIGAMLANRVPRWLGLGPTIIGSIFIGGFVGVLVAIAPSGDAAIPYLVASGIFGGVGRMVHLVNTVSFRQAICPPRMQGRMNATMRFLNWGTIPIGSVLSGILASTIGLHDTIWVGAILFFIPAVFPLLSPVRALRTLPVQIDTEEVAAPA
jgi:MFS family permease